ncbi:MAG TPA: hypothetical protein PK082_03925, partial [Phycisphaerae bacterium]|nr:hypothetical protein [Phycisphaerae bacterium]
MAVEFRCEKCGKILNVNAEPGSATRCPHCGRKVVTPAGLASLPRPQVPPERRIASPAAAPAPRECYEEESAVLGAMAGVMPWVISLFFHVGLGLIMAFVTLFVVESRNPENVVIPNLYRGELRGAALTPPASDPTHEKTPRPSQSAQYSRQETNIPRNMAQTKTPVRLIGAGAGAMGIATPPGLSMGRPSGPRSVLLEQGG